MMAKAIGRETQTRPSLECALGTHFAQNQEGCTYRLLRARAPVRNVRGNREQGLGT